MMWEPGIEIKRLEDVTPFLTEGIAVKERDGYTSVDYSYAGPETFSNPMATECRGLKFDARGNLIARPFQKFFNVGEREAPEDIDWRSPHTVYDKLDGSMVHGCLLDGELALMTRGGVTPQSRMATDRAPKGALLLAKDCAHDGRTAIFEFTSPDNRIVISYEDDRLTLLAIRHNLTGEYASDEALAGASSGYGVPLAPSHAAVGDYPDFLKAARGIVGAEGYVIAFASGHRLKIKGGDYVFRHKALASIGSAKNVLQIIMDERTDDVCPMLSEALAQRLRGADRRLRSAIADRATEISRFVLDHRDMERKDFAAAAFGKMDKRFTAAAFGSLDGRDAFDILAERVRRANTIEKVKEVGELYGFEWSLDDIPVHELSG